MGEWRNRREKVGETSGRTSLGTPSSDPTGGEERDRGPRGTGVGSVSSLPDWGRDSDLPGPPVTGPRLVARSSLSSVTHWRSLVPLRTFAGPGRSHGARWGPGGPKHDFGSISPVRVE